MGKPEQQRRGHHLLDGVFDVEAPNHSASAGVVLAAAEAIEALLLNGDDPRELRAALFGLFIERAENAPFLRELMRNWLEWGEFEAHRLEELHDYNRFLRNDAIGDDSR